jgi:hypothetical protein
MISPSPLNFLLVFINHIFEILRKSCFVANGSAISCCSDDGRAKLHHEERHYACMAIDIPHKDPFYNQFNQKCMNFVRSVLAPRQDCTLGYAQQVCKKLTHICVIDVD